MRPRSIIAWVAASGGGNLGLGGGLGGGGCGDGGGLGIGGGPGGEGGGGGDGLAGGLVQCELIEQKEHALHLHR